MPVKITVMGRTSYKRIVLYGCAACVFFALLYVFGPLKKLIRQEDVVIHLATPIIGPTATAMAMTMLKSIEYQLGRYNRLNEGCAKPLVLSNSREDSSNVHIHYHILTDNNTRKLLSNQFNTWNIENIQPYYYDIQPVMNKAKRFATHHYGGYASLSKLWLPDILPETVRKVILIDSDFILMDDIRNLWDFVDTFSSKQIFGMAEEQCTYYRRVFGKTYLQDFPYGYNGGLVLMDLKKLRFLEWNKLWNSALLKEIEQIPLPTGDQDILNLLAHRHKDFLFPIPCGWNMVGNFDNLPRCECALVQISNKAFPNDGCAAKAIHFNSDRKPEVLKYQKTSHNLSNHLSKPTTRKNK